VLDTRVLHSVGRIEKESVQRLRERRFSVSGAQVGCSCDRVSFVATRNAVLDLSEKLKELTAIQELQLQYSCIKRSYGWFEAVRKDLGVSRHLSGNGQKAKPTDAKEVKERLEKTLGRIGIEGRELRGDFQAAAEKIVEEFRGHWDELVVDVKDKFGNTVKIVRHNGIEERGHRWSRMHTRRRTGRSRTDRLCV
jgi:hypothetical protein